MKIIVGLGNPGEQYRHTRHNAGLDVVAALARAHGVRLRAGRGDFMNGSGSVAGHPMKLVVPLCYMNLSGTAVSAALDELGGTASHLIVVCDDVNLPLGRLRFRAGGSDGGHNGLASIIRALGTEQFTRLRLGVGDAPAGVDRVDYVTEPFEQREMHDVSVMIDRAVEALELLVSRGIHAAMNEHNRWPVDGESTEA